MSKMNFQFTINVKASVKLTDEEVEQFNEWKSQNPNEFPLDLVEVEKDILSGLDIIESNIEMLDEQYTVEE